MKRAEKIRLLTDALGGPAKGWAEASNVELDQALDRAFPTETCDVCGRGLTDPQFDHLPCAVEGLVRRARRLSAERQEVFFRLLASHALDYAIDRRLSDAGSGS